MRHSAVGEGDGRQCHAGGHRAAAASDRRLLESMARRAAAADSKTTSRRATRRRSRRAAARMGRARRAGARGDAQIRRCCRSPMFRRKRQSRTRILHQASARDRARRHEAFNAKKKAPRKQRCSTRKTNFINKKHAKSLVLFEFYGKQTCWALMQNALIEKSLKRALISSRQDAVKALIIFSCGVRRPPSAAQRHRLCKVRK